MNLNKDNKYPEIRFKGFTEDWEQREWKTVMKVNSGRDYKHLDQGEVPVYGTGGYMLSVNGALSNEDSIGIGRKGTIDKPQYLTAPFWTVDTLFYMTPLKNYNLQFLYFLSQKINWKKLDESTGVPSLSKINIEKITQYFPNTEEQLKIGEFFDQLENTIALHQCKLDKLKSLKKAYLQVLFPEKDQETPYMSFAKVKGTWEQRKLSEVADIIGGGTPSTINPDYWNGNIDWYSPVEIGDQIYLNDSIKKITELGLKKSSAKILPVGSILFTSRAGIGNTAILAKEAATNQGFQSIVPHKNKLNSYFIYSRTNELKRYGEITGAGSTFVEVSGKQMAKMLIRMPSIEEQCKIGNFFKQFDRIISFQQQKLNKFKELKKAYLNKMFV
ncbi:restriction endonuclease subunit S [Marinilactibacillus psychrotolerans]|uniref:Restriction endonuclease subunit S n=1 Tax=Marinilactibacillus psychrotolerans TaxID=191770 RepID=A0ABW8ULZ8_9LACT